MPESLKEEKQQLRREKEQLRRKEEQLRRKEEQLREKEALLINEVQQKRQLEEPPPKKPRTGMLTMSGLHHFCELVMVNCNNPMKITVHSFPITSK